MNTDSSAFDHIEHLLATKSFGELDAAEQKLVLTHFDSASEYEMMRDGLPRFDRALQNDALDLKDDPGTLLRLKNRMEVAPKSSNVKHGSLLGLLWGILPGKLAGLKAGIMAIVMLGMVWMGEPGVEHQEGVWTDSTATLSDTFPAPFMDSVSVGFPVR